MTARAQLLSVREDEPGTGWATTITNQAGTVVLDGTAVVWRDPLVAASFSGGPAGTGGGELP